MEDKLLLWQQIVGSDQVMIITVIARSEATWQSPGTIHRFAVQELRCDREIATGLTALAMTQ